MKRAQALVLGCFVLIGHSAWGQDRVESSKDPLVVGVVETLYSEELSENRTLNIHLPEGYELQADSVYPVIYLLDGSINEDLIHVIGITQFLTMIQVMPASIIVGIANVDRKRDFSFPTSNAQDKMDFPTTGGSERFIAFLEKELIPFIEQNYRTSGDRTLIGQSFGGLLATEVLLKHTGSFHNYIIVSPSLWWNDGSLLKEASAFPGRKSESPVYVDVSVGSEGDEMVGHARDLAAGLKKLPGVTVNYAYMPEEDHLTILHNSVYRALRSLHRR